MARLLDQANQILAEKQAKILPENIKSGITCFDVTGTVTELAGEEIVITPSIEQQIIIPSEGKNGITSATVNAVTSEIDANIIAENIKKDISILGVTGTLEGSGGTVEGIKQFATVEEMNNSTGNKEGNLAIVYRSEIRDTTQTSEFQIAVFPKTVVLDNPITDSISFQYKSADGSEHFSGSGYLSNSQFTFDAMTESIMLSVYYSSSDGITYTRSSTKDDPKDLGEKVCFYNNENSTWNDAIGKFIQCSGTIFNGLYKSIIDTNIIQFYNLSAFTLDISGDKSSATLNINEIDKHPLEIDKTVLINFCNNHNISLASAEFYIDSNNDLCYTSVLSPKYNFNGQLLGYSLNGNSSTESSTFYKIDLENDTVTELFTKSANKIYYGSSTSNSSYYLDKSDLDCVTVPTYILERTNLYNGDSLSVVSTNVDDFIKYIYKSYTYNYQGLRTKYIDINEGWTTN